MVLVSHSKVPSTASQQLGLCRIHGANVQIPLTFFSLEHDCIYHSSETTLSHMHLQPLLLSTNYFSI